MGRSIEFFNVKVGELQYSWLQEWARLLGPVSPLCLAVPQVVPQMDCFQMNSEAQRSSWQPLSNKLPIFHGTETGGLGHMSIFGWSMSQGLGRADWLVWVTCPLPPLQSLQDPWAGEKVIFRGNSGDEGWRHTEQASGCSGVAVRAPIVRCAYR